MSIETAERCLGFESADWHQRIREVRRPVVFHEWGEVSAPRPEHRFDRLTAYLTDYDLDYDDSPDPSLRPQRKRLIIVSTACLALLSSPQAACGVGLLGGLLLLLWTVRQWAKWYEGVLANRAGRRRGRHRAPRRTLLSIVAGTPGQLGLDDILTVARVHQRLASSDR